MAKIPEMVPKCCLCECFTTFVHDWVWCCFSVSQLTDALPVSPSASVCPPPPTTRESLLVIYELVRGLGYEKRGELEADGTGTGRGAGPQLVFD